MSASDKPAIVIDNGSFSVRAGFAGNDKPKVHIPPVVGRQRPLLLRNKLKEYYVGDSAQQMRDILNLALRYPIKHGIIEEWAMMEHVWDSSFRTLGVEASEHRILMSESPVNTRFKRARLTEILFESYHVPAMYIANTANLSLYGTGRTTGLVVDSGERLSHIVPIYEGYSLRRHIKHMKMGGEHLTDFMQQLLALRGYSFQEKPGHDTVRQIKEEMCFVAEDYMHALKKADMSTVFEKKFGLPDGRTLTLNDERFRVPEAIFEPDVISFRLKGLSHFINDAVQSSELGVRGDLYRNIVLAGGNTMFPGMAERLEPELTSLAPPRSEIGIVSVDDRVNLAWKGGSQLASSDSFDGFWITREMYQEAGIRSVNEKVF